MQGGSQYRRPLLVTIFVLLLLGVPSRVVSTLAAPSAVQAQREHPTLTLGSSGADVSELQTLLNTWIGNHPESGLAQLPISGYFGSLTDQAVRTFQQAQGLPAQGIVGPLTWAALGAGESATPAPAAPSLPTPELNGRGPVMPRGALTRRPWMVMIDNHPDAYPQSGLDKAAMVFEGLAEYGITRYIATYAEGWTPEAQQIGPVRSTRAYFAQWAEAFHPVYVHAGGSPDGLA
nr:DUF3048 domain-containing protein [Herpetosiphonaceae bacterium]